jgi:anaerobic selenocysteine-containing dehydrogenase
MFIHPATAASQGLKEGMWVRVETKAGGVKLQVSFAGHMPEGLLRVPHGWWKPEMARGGDTLSGAWDHADAQICPDDDDFLDREQGIPHFKGVPCRIVKLDAEAVT